MGEAGNRLSVVEHLFSAVVGFLPEQRVAVSVLASEVVFS